MNLYQLSLTGEKVRVIPTIRPRHAAIELLVMDAIHTFIYSGFKYMPPDSAVLEWQIDDAITTWRTMGQGQCVRDMYGWNWSAQDYDYSCEYIYAISWQDLVAAIPTEDEIKVLLQLDSRLSAREWRWWYEGKRDHDLARGVYE